MNDTYSYKAYGCPWWRLTGAPMHPYTGCCSAFGFAGIGEGAQMYHFHNQTYMSIYGNGNYHYCDLFVDGET